MRVGADFVVLPRWGSVSGPPAGREADRSGRPEHDIELAVVCTDLAVTWRRRLHLIGLRAISANSTAGPLSACAGESDRTPRLHAAMPGERARGTIRAIMPPDECERQGARALTSTSGAANSRAKHHRANGYYYNSPTTAMERQLRNQRAYERGEYYEHDSNALPFGSRACWEQKCARAPTNAEQSGPEKERSKTISRIVQSYLFRLRLTSAQAFFGLSHSRGSAKASNRLLRATCDVVRHNHLAARDG